MKPAHTRITFSGVVGSVAAPVEQWSFSLNAGPEAMAAAPTDAAADGLAANLRASYNGLLDRLPEDVILTEVRVAYINALGKTARRADGSYDQGIWQGSVAGLQAKQAMPLQIALVVSLMTERAGPSGKGRFFLPWPAVAFDSTTKRIASEPLTAVTEDVRDFLDLVNGQIAGSVSVVSSLGHISPVRSIKIGRAPDTLRSRRENVDEGYIALPLA